MNKEAGDERGGRDTKKVTKWIFFCQVIGI